jgi:hypothetical protein
MSSPDVLVEVMASCKSDSIEHLANLAGANEGSCCCKVSARLLLTVPLQLVCGARLLCSLEQGATQTGWLDLRRGSVTLSVRFFQVFAVLHLAFEVLL